MFVIGCQQKESAVIPSEGINEDIEWYSSLDSGLTVAKQKKKLLMVDFYTDWCGWCKKLDNETYKDPDVIQYSQKFVCVKIDGDKDKMSVSRYRVDAFPAIYFLDSDGNIISKVRGFRPAEEFLAEMKNVIRNK